MRLGTRVALAIERLLESACVPACSVALVECGGVAWSAAFGLADVRARRAAEPSTLYHLFSGTKLFTATAVLQLVEGGALDLGAEIGAYLPELPREVRTVTLRALLSHTSGLKDTPRGFLAVYFPGEAAPSAAEALKGYKLQLSAGGAHSKVRYANANYAVLGELISRVSGLPYRDYVRERVLTPLSSDAQFDVSECDGARLATGYVDRWDMTRLLLRLVSPATARRIYRPPPIGRLFPLNDYSLSTAAAGGLIGSVSSFAPFVQAQLNGGAPLLSAPMLQRMQTLVAAGKAGVESSVGVGLGWKIGVVENSRFLNHEGSGAGFTSELRLYPDEGVGLVLLMNKSSMSRTMRVAHRICELIRRWRSSVSA